MTSDFTPEEEEDIKSKLEGLSGEDRGRIEDAIFEEYKDRIDENVIGELLDSFEKESPEMKKDKMINLNLGRSFLYGKKNLRRSHFKDFDITRLIMKTDVIGEKEADVERIVDLLNTYKNIDKDNENIYNEIIDAMEGFLSGYREEEIPENIIDMFTEVEDFDLKLITERERFYKYWEGINRQFDVLIKAIDGFKEVAEDDKNLNEEIKKKIEDLPDPVNYIINVKPYNIPMEDPDVRIIKMLIQLGVIEDRLSEKEKHEPTMGMSGTDLQFNLRQKKKHILDFEVPSEKVTTGKVDPVLHYALEDMDIPIALDEGDKIPKMLKDLSEGKGISENNKRGLLQLIQIIDKQASSLFYNVELIGKEWKDVAPDNYVPISPFIEEYATEMRVTEIQNISKKTSNFLSLLQEILLEKHTLFPIYQKEAKLHAGKDFKTILPKIDQGMAGRSDSDVLDRKRQQLAKLPKERKLGSAKKFKDARKKLIKALNTYYFLPLSGKGKFLDAPPRFSYQSGEWATIPKEIEGEKVIEERQHRKTQIAGSHALRSLKFAFSESPATIAEKENFLHLHENIDEEFIVAMKTYFTRMNQKVTFDESLYKLFESTVNQLNKVIPNSKKNNETYFGNKLYEYAIEMGKNTNELKPFMGSEINTHHRKYEKGQHMGTYYPMAELRSLLEEDTLKQHITREKDYMGSTLDEEIDDLLDLMNPRPVEKEDRINRKLLEAHDSIRKMQGKEIIKGYSKLDRVDSMDYVINYIYSSYNIDINASEVSTIVKSIDSFKNISTNFGIGEEVIYEIKGLCR